ncbi:hypothetical protein [Paraliomyxa miuraensis]|uniref:hypothetical protein n=1 Tax=Paraliomyxa miuraensis TaxID=376150 RepID=UPI0022560CC0|nr:hypothetical protein [Paraliomyxa miuraensis]MCX4239963.1 hypothetical protein [Paraliomyxa miuraensis]
MRSSSCRAIVVALVLGIVGCRDVTPASEDIGGSSESSGGGSGAGTEPDVVDGDSTGEPTEPDACEDACIDLGSEDGIAGCHACRCKIAFDDWLPSVDELQCQNAEAIVTHHAVLSETGYTLEPAPPGATDCANPSFLTGSCQQGSKLGQLTHGDVSVYWICRDPYLDLDGSVLFEDMAVIGHNARTGATCFWDDINDQVHEDDAPPLDLSEATEDERARSVEVFKYNDGSSCVTCHDHDPFIYTPHLQSTGWASIAANKRPYHLVDLRGEPRPTGVMHLVSPQADACTSCHRLGSRNTCSSFAPDSMGSHKLHPYEDEVHAAAEPGSPYWELAYWMPTASVELADFDAWEAAFGEARDHVLECCAAPGVDAGDCRWEAVPSE